MTIKRLLITGAAGHLGRALREGLAGMAETIRVSDRAPLEPMAPHEEAIRCDLSDGAAVEALLEGVDAVVHLGGHPGEAPWDVILQSNIMGAINLWEAARKAGTKRIVYASSAHVVGMYPRSQRIDHLAPARPDSRYGLSKAFGEDLASLFAYKYGISAFCIRIGSSFPKPKNTRMLGSWMSYRDLVELFKVGLTADYLYEIVYGVSKNAGSWWDNSNAHDFGFDPRDSADDFAAGLGPANVSDPLGDVLQGGAHASTEYEGDTRRVLETNSVRSMKPPS